MEAGNRGLKGGRDGRDTSEASVAAGLPVTDGPAQPTGQRGDDLIVRGKSGTGGVAVRRWEEVGDEPEAGGAVCKRPQPIGHPVKAKGGGPGFSRCQGSMLPERVH